MKLFNHRIDQRLRAKNFIGTASKTFDDYFALDLYAQLFARKTVPIATYFFFSQATDKVNIRRWVLNSWVCLCKEKEYNVLV